MAGIWTGQDEATNKRSRRGAMRLTGLMLRAQTLPGLIAVNARARQATFDLRLDCLLT